MHEDQGRGADEVQAGVKAGIADGPKEIKKTWTIRKFEDADAYARGDAYGVAVFHDNVLLNEGIGELLDVACGLGSPTAFNNASAYLGVGDDNTAAAATQTGLQAASPAYAAMESGYPSRADQTVTWRSVFGSSVANFNWREFTVANGNSNSAKNLNRKVSTQGTKASGQVWTLDLAITIS